jgi:hypothetical protein
MGIVDSSNRSLFSPVNEAYFLYCTLYNTLHTSLFGLNQCFGSSQVIGSGSEYWIKLCWRVL